MNKKFEIFMVLVAMLAGCRANQEPLADSLTEVEKEITQDVHRLTVSKPNSVVAFEYNSGHLPFDLPAIAPSSVRNNTTTCWQPPSRGREPLEQFAIEQLSLKGIMTKGNARVALIQTPEYRVMKVGKGQYLGRNKGRVAEITAQKVIIDEHWSDGQGCWSKRVVHMVLQ
jgi:type IV pilus assembly protein PilP